MSILNTSACLAIASLDRYVTPGIAGKNTALINLYSGVGPPANKFSITSSGSFIYGYINKIVVSQIQVDYRIPTVVPCNLLFASGQDHTQPPFTGNDTFVLKIYTYQSFSNYILVSITIPYGFYKPVELAAMLQVILSSKFNMTPETGDVKVYYSNSGAHPQVDPVAYGYGNGFIIETNLGYNIQFPTVSELKAHYNDTQITAILKCYRLLGVEQGPIVHPPSNYYQTQSPVFLYTPFIDICSFNLTKYQKVKDSDTTVSRKTGLIGRVYLSALTSDMSSVLGTEPFMITTDPNTPKVIKWSPEEAVYSLDFTAFDAYGDSMYWDPNYPTEYNITILCQEDDF